MPDDNRNEREKAECRSKLQIDEDDLNTALIEQPAYFDVVARNRTEARAAAALAKQELTELMAELAMELRREAAQTSERITEGQISNMLTTDTAVKAANRKYLRLLKESEDWESIRDSFSQRGYALKDLTAIWLRRYDNVEIERGNIGASRRRITERVADRVQSEQEELRRERRRQAQDDPPRRYRPRDQGD